MAYRMTISFDAINPGQDARRALRAPGCRGSIQVGAETAFGALSASKHEAVRRGWRSVCCGWSCHICREGTNAAA